MTYKRWPRALLLASMYMMGILGIVATGGGGSDGDDGPSNSCGIQVNTIAPATDGSNDIWIGVLTDSANSYVSSVVRLNSNGSEKLRIPVSTGIFDIVRTVEVAADGSNDVYVGGDFSEGIFRLNGDGSVDANFNVGSGFNSRVSKITAAADGTGDIYVAGFFSEYNGSPVSGLVRLKNDGSLDIVVSTLQQVEDVELAGPTFPGAFYSGANQVSPNPTIARWNSNGSQDGGFNATIGRVATVMPALDGTGDVYAGGPFLNGIVRLNSNGTTDAGFLVGSGFNSLVFSIVSANDMTGNIYVVGFFTTYDGTAANGIVRLNSNGSPDANFIYGSGFTDPKDPFPFSKVDSASLAADMSGDIYVGGGYSFYNGIASNGIVRLNTDGSRDSNFSVQISSDWGQCNDNF